jgi:hypothetical protein
MWRRKADCSATSNATLLYEVLVSVACKTAEQNFHYIFQDWRRGRFCRSSRNIIPPAIKLDDDGDYYYYYYYLIYIFAVIL